MLSLFFRESVRHQNRLDADLILLMFEKRMLSIACLRMPAGSWMWPTLRDSNQLVKLLSNSLLGKTGYVLGYYYPLESGRQDLNLRPLRPERSALAKLSYSPVKPKCKYNSSIVTLQAIINLLDRYLSRP